MALPPQLNGVTVAAAAAAGGGGHVSLRLSGLARSDARRGGPPAVVPVRTPHGDMQRAHHSTLLHAGGATMSAAEFISAAFYAVATPLEAGLAWLQSLPLWVLIPACLVLAGVLLVAAMIAAEMLKPTPRVGSACMLPNGMAITHWQQSETDFLYSEIWGAESAYAGGRGGGGALRFAPGAVIVDAGANIGMFSLYAAARCGGHATIYAFEPIPSTHGVLAANAAAANAGAFGAVFQPRRGARLAIKAFNVGLSDTAADVVFEHHPNFSVWSTTDADFAKQRIDRIAGDLPRATQCVFCRTPLGRPRCARRRAEAARPALCAHLTHRLHFPALSSLFLVSQLARARRNSSHLLVRLLPAALVSWVGGLILSKVGRVVKVNARLVTLSSIIEAEGIDRIDILKVDVEGAELSLLRGIADRHWAKVQQLALEVESFAIRDTIIALLTKKGFHTSAVASERERTPGVLSEVCMVYAWRPQASDAGDAGGAAAAPRARSKSPAAKSPAAKSPAVKPSAAKAHVGGGKARKSGGK